MRLPHLVASFLLTLITQSAAEYGIRDLGRTVTLGNITYFIPGSPEVVTPVEDGGVFGLNPDKVHFIPITHVRIDEPNCHSSVQKYLESYATTDDVWSEGFQNYIFTSGNVKSRSLRNDPSIQIFNVDSSSTAKELSRLPRGPYFAQVTRTLIYIFKAYRVYPDPAGAFYYGLLEQEDGSFEVLSATSPLTNGEGATIAVPSRLYYAAPSEEKPLSGVRVGVKDLYDLKGLRKSAGSRAYFDLYEPALATAPSIQYLIDLGAVIVGRTKTSQFANGQSPTADWVDFHDPFNARGDGYQDPSSSSAGAGSAASNYDWIDLNIGSDTGGSVRAPAAVSGVFGNRPSQDIMTLDGAIPLSSYMDTPAFIARSASDFAAWGKAWYGAGNTSLKPYQNFPSKLIYPIDTLDINTTQYPSPGFFPSTNADAQVLFDEFTAGLERLLGTKRTVVDFYTKYKETSGTGLYPLDHLGAVWTLMTAYEQYRKVIEPMVSAWSTLHDGDSPYLDPQVALNAEYGRNSSESFFNEALTNKTIFKNWLETELLIPQHDTPHCSSALIIHPIVSGTPSYRDNYPTQSPEQAGVSFVWNQYSISQLGGVPEVVLPLGQVNYTSRITGTTKYLPVAVSINAAAGCDFMLYSLVEKLAKEGIIPDSVKTGPSLF
ncbi:amidase signature domain-containing protein [Xylariaceae sp. FL1272]|nr:amidase signature domain-containing protein [Xylariaceae sp. FL1272]